MFFPISECFSKILAKILFCFTCLFVLHVLNVPLRLWMRGPSPSRKFLLLSNACVNTVNQNPGGSSHFHLVKIRAGQNSSAVLLLPGSEFDLNRSQMKWSEKTISSETISSFTTFIMLNSVRQFIWRLDKERYVAFFRN